MSVIRRKNGRPYVPCLFLTARADKAGYARLHRMYGHPGEGALAVLEKGSQILLPAEYLGGSVFTKNGSLRSEI